MVEILRLYFDNDIQDDFLELYTTQDTLEKTGVLTEIKMFYEFKNKNTMIAWDYFQEFGSLAMKLKLVINRQLLLHDSIVKNIGFYQNQYTKNENRKNLVYKKNENGVFWIGGQYKLFDFEGLDSWLYNDKDGNIVFELTPAYTWFYSDPKPGETFIKYSDWMKQYQPLLKRIISKEVAQEWFVKLQELTVLVQKISKTLPCGGMLDCGGCIHLGEQND